MSRRNFFIRTVATLTGDLALGYSMALACTWVIQAAALGPFLSFMAWLVGILAALALSQYVVHPALQFALSDRKLDRGLAALSSLVQTVTGVHTDAGSPSWSQLRSRVGRFAGSFAAR